MSIENYDSQTVNKFVGLSYVPYNIVVHLFDNEKIWQLIKYTTPDALTKPILTTQQKASLIWKGEDNQEDFRVFFIPMVENVNVDQAVILRVYRLKVNPMNPIVAGVTYAIEIMCQTKISMLYDGRTRLDVLWEEIMRSLNGVEIGAVGRLMFDAGKGGDRQCISDMSFENSKNYFGYGTVFKTNYSSGI